ncbi:MAG: hypothetical protein Sv326_0654 [Candidatus Fermentimicrarchaeum limneticum]|uniref:Morc S5 domain-containing protein n=1 Tax=Fermentimicrarchaeum limneticum TaxID=2795018 RepID=A0A7D5XJQ0_FERL1|nr:MAG: hypothetical protein Sv326_0654 [Candidatus Fermentimicrarchaeum limneticum]
MNEEEAISSLRLADTTKEGTTNLGQFGLGLKTGALTLGKKFTVITTQEKLKNQFRIDFDEDKFEKEGDWRKHSFFIEPKTFDHGTVVTITDLKFNVYRVKIDRLVEDFSIRFGPFLKLENNQVKIIINNKTLEYKEREFLYTQNSIVSFSVNNKRVNGWFNFLKKRAVKSSLYGFHLFKNNRLIKAFAKEELGLYAHPEKAQIYGELYLDDFPTTHNKKEFLMDTPDWEKLIEKLGEIIAEPISKHMDFVIGQRKRKKIVKAVTKLADYFSNLNIEAIKSEFEDEELKKIEIKPVNFEKIHIDGEWYSFEPRLLRLGERRNLFSTDIENNNIKIEVNIDFPLFKIKDNYEVFETLVIFTVSEALAKIMIQKRKEDIDSFFKQRDLILNSLVRRPKSKEEKREINSLLRYS